MTTMSSVRMMRRFSLPKSKRSLMAIPGIKGVKGSWKNE